MRCGTMACFSKRKVSKAFRAGGDAGKLLRVRSFDVSAYTLTTCDTRSPSPVSLCIMYCGGSSENP